MKRKTLFWAALFALLALAGAAVYALRGGGTAAVVTLDGKEVGRVDLAAVAVAFERTYRSERGWNTVRFSPGGVAVVDADCPGHDCMEQGEITDGAIPIVCLPHRLVIEIKE